MKAIYLFFIGLFIQFSVFSQFNADTPLVGTDEIKSCGEYEALEKMRQENPVLYEKYKQSRLLLEQSVQLPTEKSETIYTIPVVFHILHNNGSENISDAQVQDALAILNRDYRKQNSDANNVVSQFLPIVGDVKIEFAFATIAPDGTCFNGITRTISSQTSNGDDGEAQTNAVINGNDIYQGVWPHNKYLNIFVCKKLISGAAGYTYKPMGNTTADAEHMYYNGIFILHNYTGSIGTSSNFSSRALTHEVGHWFNLSHTWGDGQNGTCGDDFVSDTPKTEGSTPPCNLSKSSCDGTLDNVENYMDYGYCSKMFTLGQVTRMRNAAESNVAGRSNIWTNTNLQEVGVLPGGTSSCSVDIDASALEICTGGSTTFSATAMDGPITNYSWTFQGGAPSMSTIPNPVVTYNSPGNYDVGLSYTTASGNHVVNMTAFITVTSSGTAMSLPFTEGFVSNPFPPVNWTISNGGNLNTWVKNASKGTSPTPGNSAMIDFYTTNTTGDKDDLNTPIFSLANYSAASLKFDVAYQPYNSIYKDKLEVLVSPGCGMDYVLVYSKEGTSLQTETATQSAYTQPSTWRNETVDLSPYAGNTEVKIKFRGTSGWGNYLYLDNINISGTVSSIADFITSEDKVCAGESITFTNTSTDATSWNWNFGAGANPATATGAGPHVVSYTSSGSKTATLSINNGESTVSYTVSVDPLPSVTFDNLSSVCEGKDPFVLSQGNPAGGTYSGNGVSGNQFSPAVAGIGTHTLTYTVTTPAGCSKAVTQEIVVEGCLGIEDENSNVLNIFPNPTKGQVTVSSSSIIDEVYIVDNIGRTIQKQTVKAKVIQLDLRHLSSGSYFIYTKSGTFQSVNKLIVE